MIRRPSKSFLCISIVMLVVSVLLTRWLSTRLKWLDPPLEPRLVLRDNYYGLDIRGSTPDNTLLYTRASGKVNAWNLQTGHLKFQVAGLFHTIDDGGRRLGLEVKEGIGIFDAQTGEQIKTLHLPDPPKSRFSELPEDLDFRFSADGTLLCFEDFRNFQPDVSRVAFWRLDSGEEVGVIESRYENVAVSPDGGRIAAWQRQEEGKLIIRLWRTTGDSPITLLAEHHMPGLSAAFTSDGAIFATSSVPGPNGTEVALWETESAKKIDSVLVEEALAYPWLSFSVPADFLFADPARILRVSPKLVDLGKFEGRPELSPDGRLLATAFDFKGIALYRASDMAKLGDLVNPSDYARITIISHGPPPYPIANFSPDGRWLVVDNLGPLNSDSRPTWFPQWVPWPAGNSGINWNRDQMVRIWDTETCREAHSFTGCNGIIFSPDSHSMIVSLNDRVEVYELPLSKPPYRIALCSLGIWLLLMMLAGFARWLLHRRAAA